jgi:hypothetical protein
VDELKAFLANPYTWFGIGVAGLLGVFWERISEPIANVTIVLSVTAISVGLFLWSANTRLDLPLRFAVSVTTWGVLFAAGYITLWAPPAKTAAELRTDTIDAMTKLAQKGAWNELAEQLPAIEANTGMRDVGLYFRGLLYSNAKPAPDPEQFLSQVPQESSLFAETQRLRYSNYATSLNPQLAAAILQSLERASMRSTTYYALRLQPPPVLSYQQVSALYNEFTERHSDLFNFTDMREGVTATQGKYLTLDLRVVIEIPACVALFTTRLAETAHHECRTAEKMTAIDRFDLIMKNTSPGEMKLSFKMLNVNPAIQQRVEYLRTEPLPQSCQGERR